MEDYELTDNTERKRYEFHINGLTPLIDYIKNKNGAIYLTHTEVPFSLQGKGIGHVLVKKVLEDIDRQGLKVVPTCSFVAIYIRRHPEWQHLLMSGISLS